MSQEKRIIGGSLELFLQAGIKSVTMDDIARHLGMSKKTIYQFFSDKNEVVVALVKDRLAEDERQIEEIIEHAANVIEEMLNMMKCSEDIFSRINPIVFHDLQKYHPKAWQEFMKFKHEFLVSKLEILLQKGIDQGFMRPDIDVAIMARLRVNEVEMGFNTAIFPVSHFNTWRVQLQMLEHFNYGICTLKGHQLLDQYKTEKIAL